jgi:putative DNA primase/helicase
MSGGNGLDKATGSGPVASFAELEVEITALAKWLGDVQLEPKFEFGLSQLHKRSGIPKAQLRKWANERAAKPPDDQLLPTSIEEANQVVDGVQPTLPKLIIDRANLRATALALRDILAKSENLFDRDGPAEVVDSDEGPLIQSLDHHTVAVEAHRLCQPHKYNAEGNFSPTRLPVRDAQTYLAVRGKWRLKKLAGISSAPLLDDTGGMRTAKGYDPATHFYCAGIPDVDIPERPSSADAQRALRLLRSVFGTFPFADATTKLAPELGKGVRVVIDEHPRRDESSFLCQLMGAVCRPSLWLAPGLMVTAAMSGGGSGKGLLLRSVSAIAFGIQPEPFTAGDDRQELEKRVVGTIIAGSPVAFLDNVNGAVLRSATLSSVLTERPSALRPLGTSRLVKVECTAFVGVTGNGLTLSEDLVRKFVVAELDAQLEDASSREFAPGFLKMIQSRRLELLAAVLTIWRWGRQNAVELKRGRAFGSYEQWGHWCRDPLLTLGCADPIERVAALKQAAPEWERRAAVFKAWREAHGKTPVPARLLAFPVRVLGNPKDNGENRQAVASYVGTLVGTRHGGLVLRRHESPDEGPASYALEEDGT